MHYFGGKSRLSKEICEILNKELKENQSFVDLFCGACNIIEKIEPNRIRIANDKHKYLIEMWKALQNGWIPPDDISEEEYKYTRENKDENMALTGFVGFGCAFAGKWFGGYARSNDKRNYAKMAKNSLNKKIINLYNVEFTNKDYSELKIPKGSLVYCDIPYENSTKYCKKEVGIFNHNDFYDWVENNKYNYDIYISEYKENVREGFKIIWEKESKTGIRKNNRAINTTEVLIRPII